MEKKIAQGAFSGLVAAIILQPLSLITTQSQVINRSPLKTSINIFKSQGIKGYYKGLSYNLYIAPLFYGIYLPIYHHFKGDDNISIVKATIISYCTASLIINPIYVLRVRAQNKLVMDSNSTLGLLWKKEGIRGLYKGYGISLFKGIELILQMPIQEKLKEYLPVPLATFVARSIGVTITYPLEVLRVKIRNEPRTPKKIALELLKSPSNWYRGYSVYTLRSSSKAMIVFTLYEYLLNSRSIKK